MSKEIINNNQEEYILGIKEKLSKLILSYIQSKKMKQKTIQELLNIKQPRVSDLVNGKLEKFSVDSLLAYLYDIEHVIEDFKANERNDYINNIKIKIISSIKKISEENRFKQKHLQDLFLIKQPRVSDLINNKFEKFSIDSLLCYVHKLGYVINLNTLDSEKTPLSIYFTNTSKDVKKSTFGRKHIKNISAIKKAA